MEDSVKIDTTAQAKVVAPKAEKPKESNPKQVKALVKDNQEDKCIQLDLFADFQTMKPRNKYEKRVAELNATLKEDIAVRDIEWVKEQNYGNQRD